MSRRRNPFVAALAFACMAFAVAIAGPSAATAAKPVAHLDGSRAVAPKSAPKAVKRMIRAGNKIRHKKYKWGGGHGDWTDKGYDCSGAVSYALHGGKLLDVPLDSTGLSRYGVKGKGSWISVYGNPGHAYMVVAGLRFDTAATRGDGPSWSKSLQSTSGKFKVRHPRGL